MSFFKKISSFFCTFCTAKHNKPKKKKKIKLNAENEIARKVWKFLYFNPFIKLISM